jgi:hypothetical protein
MRAHTPLRLLMAWNAKPGGIRNPNQTPNVEENLYLPMAPDCQLMGSGGFGASPLFGGPFRQVSTAIHRSRHMWATSHLPGYLSLKNSLQPSVIQAMSGHVWFARKRMSIRPLAMSQKCQEAAYALQQTAWLFDHLVGEREQLVGDFETERLGSPEIDDKGEFGRRLHG